MYGVTSKIAQKISASGGNAFFVEVLEPGVTCFFKIFFGTLVGCLFVTPFIRPFSFKRMFLTYIIPVNVFTIVFDGTISVFKSRSMKQYEKLFSEHQDAIEVIRLKKRFSPLIVIQIRVKK